MAASLFHTCSIGELVRSKRPLITAPDTASLADVMGILRENRILAVAIVAPFCKWAGTGEMTMVGPKVSSDPDGNGSADWSDCQQYVAIVSILDIVMYLSPEGHEGEWFDGDLGTPVTAVIGNSPEGRLLWSICPSAPLFHAMGPLSKGVHRLLVPYQEVQGTSVEGRSAESPLGGDSGDRGETSENAATTSTISKDVQTCSAFRIFTQTDMVRFLVRHIDMLGPIVSCSVDDLGLLHPSLSVLAVPASMTINDALRMMRSHGGVNAVAVVDPNDSGEQEVGPPGWSRGGKLVGTLSASDFRGLDPKAIQEMHVMSVMEFLSRTRGSGVPLPLVSCRPTTPLATVMAEALTSQVHRVWVTDEESRLLGVVTFTDMIRAIKKELLGD